MGSDFDELMNRTCASNYGILFNNYMSGKLNSIYQDTIIFDNAIMGYMNICH